MKRKNILIFSFILITINLSAIDFQLNGIYYTSYSSSAPYTAIVIPGTNKYTGSVNIPETVYYNGITYTVNWISNAFTDCSDLISVTLPRTIKNIGGNAFSRCVNLTSIIIPSGVTGIYEYTFWECTKLTTVELPNTLTYLGQSVFEHCTNLTSISIPNSVVTIDDDVFARCTALTSITIPNSVTKIGWDVFNGCSSLKNVNIGSSVESIGWYTFSFCSSLIEINVDGNNQNYSSKNGVLFSKDLATLINCPNGLSDEYIMPNTVKTVRNFAFADCTKLTSIKMSENLNWILDDAFVRCSKLTSVDLPNSLFHFGYDAFGECTSMSSITIPNSVYSIGNCSFQGCSNLIAIHVKSPIPCSFDNSYPTVFNGLSTNTCVLYVPVGSKTNYQNAPQWWSFKNIVEETTDIKQMSPSLLGVYTQDRKINFRNLIIGELIQIYTQDGKLVFEEKAKEVIYSIQLPKNKLYIIKIGEKCTKIVL